MTSFAIIPHEGQKVNPQYQKTTEFVQFVRPAPILPLPVTPSPTTQVTAKRCKAFDPSPYALNSWAAKSLSFQWHGDDVASFDGETHALVSRKATTTCAIFRHLDQPATRVIMCADLFLSIIARTTSQTCNRERVVQKKRVGAINPDSTVASIVPTYLSLVAASFELKNFDFGSDPSLPLDAEQVLFCTSQLGAMGCS